MTIVFHDVGFNKEWVASMDYEVFRGHPSLSHLWSRLPEKERDNRFRKVHKMCYGDYKKSSGQGARRKSKGSGSTHNRPDEG